MPSHFCGAQNCTQYPRGGRANAGYSGMINSFDQRVLLCLICQSWSAIFLLTYTVCHRQEPAASLGPSLCTTGIFPILRAALELERRTAGSVTHLGLLFLLPCLGFLSCPVLRVSSFCLFFTWLALTLLFAACLSLSVGLVFLFLRRTWQPFHSIVLLDR